MKRTVLGAIIATALIGSISMFGGCATMRGDDKVVKAPTKELQKAQTDMKQAIVQVDATTSSLNTLVKPDQVALKKAFEEYSNNVNQMENVSKRVDRNAADLRTEGRQYFTELQQQELNYTDSNLRQASSERRSQLDRVYSKVPQTTNQLNEALTAYVADLKQIQTYLSTDLTPAGVEAMRSVAQQAIAKGENVKRLAEPAITATSQALTAMTHGSAGAAAGGQ